MLTAGRMVVIVSVIDKRKEVGGMKCKCKKCGFEWASVVDAPRACPACKSYHWQQPRKRKEAKR